MCVWFSVSCPFPAGSRLLGCSEVRVRSAGHSRTPPATPRALLTSSYEGRAAAAVRDAQTLELLGEQQLPNTFSPTDLSFPLSSQQD